MRIVSSVTSIGEPAMPASDGSAYVAVAGEYDIATVAELVEAVRSAMVATDRPHLQLDLSRVTFFGAVAVSALLQLREDARAQGGDLEVAVASRPVLRVLQLTETSDLLAAGLARSP
jgi:anti-anti-sigma factor